MARCFSIKDESNLEKTVKRIAELDKLLMRIYKDNVSGKLYGDHFSNMFNIYGDEQRKRKPLLNNSARVLIRTKNRTTALRS